MSDAQPGSGESSALDQALTDQPRSRGHRATKRRRFSSCLPVLLVLAVLGGLLYFGASQGLDAIRDQFSDPEDFAGPGQGSVTFEVMEGDSLTAMGRNLEEQGVVASVDAFTDATDANPDSTGIQVGFYELQREMRASDVVEVLVDPANIVTSAVTVPEGLRVVDIVDLLVENTDFGRAAYQKVLDAPQSLGLPSYAEGNPEGYLFPATYAFGPNEKPRDILRAMVARWEQAAADADLEGAAERLGYTPQELMTVASLVEAEARPVDMPKVARVIFNRLENPDNGITNGLLQIDATVNYALGRNLGLQISQEDLDVDSPYNTRRFAGLPPGPIEAPGDAALEAAGNPADGNWLFYVTVDPNTGETKFTDDFEEFQGFAQDFRDFCDDNPGTCEGS